MKSVFPLDEKGSPALRDAMQAMVEYVNAEYVALAGEAPVPINEVRSARIEFHGSEDNTLYTVDLSGILQEKAVLKRDTSLVWAAHSFGRGKRIRGTDT